MSDADDRPVALVTGAARGIGAATSRQLAGAGWRVALVDLGDRAPDGGPAGGPAAGPTGSAAGPPATVAPLTYPLAGAAELEAARADCGEDALALAADVRVQAEVDAAVEATVGAFGRLDAVVAAAGAIAGGRPVWETPDDVWQAMLDVNLTGAWRLVRAAVPHLLARPAPRQGRVVVVASAASFDGLPLLGAYTAAKHGVTGLVKALAAELGPEGITANAVCPGSTRTAMLEASAAVYGLGSVEEFVVHQALGRLLEPDEVAAAVTFLCSPAAAAVTGSIIAVDGGMTSS